MLVSNTAVPDHDSRLPDARADPSATTRHLSLASHELRTPLSVASGYLRMLQRDAADFTDRHRKMIDEAETSCAHMAELLHELSTLAQLDDGRMTLRTMPLDLFALVAEVRDKAAPVSEHGVLIELRGHDRPVIVRGDAHHLRAAFSSCIAAVVREQPDGARVIVARRRMPGAALVVIARETDVEAASEVAEASFDDMRGGLGMKLLIARRVIERHGGRVWSPAGPDGVARSRGPILISLPAAE